MVLALLSAPLLALADQVTCESVNNRRAECDMNTRGEVRLVRQLGRTSCVETANWDVNRSSIWVDRGCAGVFVSGDALNSGSAGGSSRGRRGARPQSSLQAAQITEILGYSEPAAFTRAFRRHGLTPSAAQRSSPG
jgi:AraC-like DNA-binding protein